MATLSVVPQDEPVIREPLFVVRVIDPPRPKERHRTVTHGRGGVPLKFPQKYTPAATKEATYRIRQALIEKYGDPAEGAFKPPEGPVCLRFTAWLKMPEDIPKYKRAIAKPIAKNNDLPNALMLLADALSGYAYKDDALVTDLLRCRKRYCGTYGGPNYPCWELEIFDAEGED